MENVAVCLLCIFICIYFCKGSKLLHGYKSVKKFLRIQSAFVYLPKEFQLVILAFSFQRIKESDNYSHYLGQTAPICEKIDRLSGEDNFTTDVPHRWPPAEKMKHKNCASLDKIERE